MVHHINVMGIIVSYTRLNVDNELSDSDHDNTQTEYWQVAQIEQNSVFSKHVFHNHDMLLQDFNHANQGEVT